MLSWDQGSFIEPSPPYAISMNEDAKAYSSPGHFTFEYQHEVLHEATDHFDQEIRTPSRQATSQSFPELLRRRSTAGAAVSSFLDRRFSGLNLRRYSSETADEVRGSLGLNLLHRPSEPLIDFIFVHGLRGDSRRTWSKSGNIDDYWPQQWLPFEPRFKNVRIHSFGYNSDWGDKRKTNLSVHDFGQSLLSEMLISPELGGVDGSTPIVLVGHSMGGIVIKKAFMLAKQDQSLSKLAARFHSMFFLATPHRGADSALLLSKLLQVSGPQSSKAFIRDLSPGSLANQMINDEFRNVYQGVQLWSFFETVSTGLGLIVDKESAVLGLPNERSQLLNADHRNICKFNDRFDSNYCTIRNALTLAIDSIERTRLSSRLHENQVQMQSLSKYLGITERPDAELSRVMDRQTEGSCTWLTDKETFRKWTGFMTDERYFCLDGEPATGKSTIAGHVIRHLEEGNGECSFFFFRHGDITKSTVALLLRSLAWQMARANSEIRQELLTLVDQAHFFDKADEGSIWRNIFVPHILRLPWRQPFYWVIDALDECSNYAALFPLLAKIERSQYLRVFITCRPMLSVERLFDQTNLARITETISISDSLADIKLFLAANADYLPADNEVERERLVARILNRSNGNFLWTSLVLQELADIPSVQQAYEALDSVPLGMDGLYSRIVETLSNNANIKAVARAILKWTVMSIRPLSVEELKEAIRLDIGITLPRLETTIGSICGNLVYLDSDSRVQLTHQTVRSFLVRGRQSSLHGPLSDFSMLPSQENLSLSQICLTYLNGNEMKAPRFRRGSVGPRSVKRSAIAEYAVTHFSDHLAKASVEKSSLLQAVQHFFATNSPTWLELVATSQDLTTLIRTAKNLKTYLKKRAKLYSPIDPAVQDVSAWARDVGHLVARFAKPLLMYPASSHFLIPSVCPPESAIARTFAKYPRALQMRGLSDGDWDDRLVCITIPGRQAYSVACQESNLALGASDGLIRLYETSTTQEKGFFNHGEPVRMLTFSTTDQYLAAASRKTLSMWSCNSGQLLWSLAVSNVPIAIAFSEDSSKLMMATKAGTMLSYEVLSGNILVEYHFSDIDETTSEEHSHRMTPMHAVFHAGLNLLGVTYRHRPVVFWDVEDGIYVGQYNKQNAAFPGPLLFSLVFHPKSEIALAAAAYDDGDVAVFDPFSQRTIATVNADASILSASPDGAILAMGHGHGQISLYDFETLKPLYKISAFEMSIRDITFSTDSLRFFVIRGGFCNVWEPTILVRDSEILDDDASVSFSEDTALLSSQSMHVHFYDEDLGITVMCLARRDTIVFCGREDGSLAAYSTSDGKVLHNLDGHGKNVAVLLMSWSEHGSVLATVDRSGRVLIQKISMSDDGSLMNQTPILDKRAPQVVRQILLNKAGDKLLVSMMHAREIWDVSPDQSGSLSTLAGPGTYWKWLNHPAGNDTLILVTQGRLRLFKWEALEETTGAEGIDLLHGLGEDLPLTAVALASNKRNICLGFSSPEQDDAPPILRVWPLRRLDPKASSLKPLATYDELGALMKHCIGVCGDDLVFLSHDGWVCSVGFAEDREVEFYTRHFFIPFRFHNNTASLITKLTGKGGVILAYRDELVVFHNGLDFQEKIGIKGVLAKSKPVMRAALVRGRSNPL